MNSYGVALRKGVPLIISAVKSYAFQMGYVYDFLVLHLGLLY